MLKHGIYQRETGGETVYDFYWMGEDLNEVDFNERLRNQMKSLFQDLRGEMEGMTLGKAVADGEAILAKEEMWNELLKAPLCEACRMMVRARRPA